MQPRVPILVVGGDEEQAQELRSALESEHCRTSSVHSLDTLERNIEEGVRHVVILDLDSLAVDNRYIRKLRKNNPLVCLIGLSSRTFHPELREAMSKHIYACLSKPVDMEEVIYWIRSICED
jgi:DNA-binding NtrC family response regulator